MKWGRFKRSKAKIGRGRLGKGGSGGGKNGCLSPVSARFSHFFLLNDFSPLSGSLEQANIFLPSEPLIFLILN